MIKWVTLLGRGSICLRRRKRGTCVESSDSMPLPVFQVLPKPGPLTSPTGPRYQTDRTLDRCGTGSIGTVTPSERTKSCSIFSFTYVLKKFCRYFEWETRIILHYRTRYYPFLVPSPTSCRSVRVWARRPTVVPLRWTGRVPCPESLRCTEVGYGVRDRGR